MKKIENSNLNLTDLFKNFYTVPDYQREYVWREKEVNQLLEDIKEEHEDGEESSEYFIGSIVVCANQQDTTLLDVIDGQQRLTTLFISLCAFKKLLKLYGEDVSDIEKMLFETKRDAKGRQRASYKLNLQYEDSSEILKYVAEDKISELEGLKGASRRISEAYEHAYHFLTDYKDVEKLKEFLGYFLNSVKLIQIETPSISDALKIFETINERGVGLNPMDLLKNLLFMQVDKSDFDKLKRSWHEISKTLEKNEEKPLRFLRYFIMANYSVKNSKGEGILREDEIYDWITKAENIKQCNYIEKPFQFTELIKTNLEAYINFINGKDKDGNPNVYLDNIKKLSGGFRLHLILLLAAKDLKKELFIHLSKQIESLIFYYMVTKEPTKEFERNFSKWTKELRSIKSKQELNRFIEVTILKEVREKQKDYENAFLRYDLYSQQRYRIRYTLAKLSQYVDQQLLGVFDEKDLSSYITKGIEIEHILPDTPKDELRRSFGSDIYEEYKIRLGNLTLFEKPKNIVAGNNFFDEKKKLYKTSQFYLTKSIAGLDVIGKDSSVNRLNKKLKEFDKWDARAIDERQGMLFGLAKDIWKVELLSEE
jgi:uncharacterized protein with ParB-like and HNH nuclease domain